MHVLIAVDETPESIEAIRVAHRIFGDQTTYTVATIGEPSHHLTAMDPLGAMSYDITTLAPPDPTYPDKVARTAVERTGIDAEIIAEIGPPGPRLCLMAAELNADVLVVGSHDRGFLSRLLDPSVQRHVANHAPCHVLIARHVRPDGE
ncbi:MAG: universal stress protein [Acidimicrobiia bacterium]|nr:universal stress protein [Acidimicrobiia bacterium]